MSLFELCQRVDYEGIQNLIEQKCDLNQIDDQGRTALHYCCEHENIDCVRLLLENQSIKKSLLNHPDNEGSSILHLACLNGKIHLVKYFCEQGADVNLVDNESHSLIHWITVCGHVELFDIVMKYRAPIHTSDIYGAFPVHYASQLCGNEETAKSLEILKKLIEYKVDVNCLDEQKRTPFIWAASAGAMDALRILYKAGADPLHVDKDSLSAIHCAATRGHASCIRMLVQIYGCPLESEDINGCTALFYAITLHHSEACQILLDLNANPNHQDNRGRTPSHCAALKGNIDCLKRLIKSHANIWIKNKRGDYPIHEAINATVFSKLDEDLQSGFYSDVIRYILESYPKSIHIRNEESRTALHLAASLGNIDICKILLTHGARINSLIQTSNNNYLTPYDLARIQHHDLCAEYLLTNHGGQRGNLIANTSARRIQNFFRRSKRRKTSVLTQRRKLFAATTQISVHQAPLVSKVIPIMNTTDNLLNQAKICLENKLVEDRLKSHSRKLPTYLITNSKEDKSTPKQRRHTETKPKAMNHESITPDKIIIHTANSVATSVKLYERHKLIAEELFKLKQARIHNHYIVISRPLYKILIENAFNPQSHHADEIEKYLETLLKAYEVELEAIRKRTKSLSPRRVLNNSQRKTPNKSNGKE